jgi:hypothetical protein
MEVTAAHSGTVQISSISNPKWEPRIYWGSFVICLRKGWGRDNSPRIHTRSVKVRFVDSSQIQQKENHFSRRWFSFGNLDGGRKSEFYFQGVSGLLKAI